MLHGRIDRGLAADDLLHGLVDLIGAGIFRQVAAGAGP